VAGSGSGGESAASAGAESAASVESAAISMRTGWPGAGSAGGGGEGVGGWGETVLRRPRAPMARTMREKPADHAMSLSGSRAAGHGGATAGAGGAEAKAEGDIGWRISERTLDHARDQSGRYPASPGRQQVILRHIRNFIVATETQSH
jgi:hypothetical protein